MPKTSIPLLAELRGRPFTTYKKRGRGVSNFVTGHIIGIGNNVTRGRGQKNREKKVNVIHARPLIKKGFGRMETTGDQWKLSWHLKNTLN